MAQNNNLQPMQLTADHINETTKSDTLKNTDTAKILLSPKHVDSNAYKRSLFFTPKKSAMFSAMVPGLGQIMNKHYWKLPIIYGGLGAAGYFIISNSNDYNYYRRIYAGRLNNDPVALSTNPNMSIEEIKFYQDQARSNLDMTMLFTALGYGIQIMDALVFAHLKGFDISEDISMKIGPSFKNYNSPGIGLVFNFK